MADFLIYGATGYTGSLIAHEAVRRGDRPILAGRNAEALAALASQDRIQRLVISSAQAFNRRNPKRQRD